MEKYGQKSSNINADVFDTGINLVIPKSHVDVARVDERGYFWDAAVALDQVSIYQDLFGEFIAE